MIGVALGCSALTGCDDPGLPEINPLYRNIEDGNPSQGERGNLMLTEVNFAGSVSDDGTYDADDVFLEFQNKNPRPINISGWRIEVDGDYAAAYRVPDHDGVIYPNEYFVVARKEDGAFGEIANVFIEDLELGKKMVDVEVRDIDRVLIEHGGSTVTRVFTGGYDTVSVRSMERISLIFGNRGGNQRNWHAFSENVGNDEISDGFREFTLASPGVANSTDYSGNASSGNFE